MKNLFKISSVISGLLTLGVLLIAEDVSATVYTSQNNGQYDNCNIWTNGCAPNEIQVGDTVIVNHNIDASSSMEISGVLIINATGDLSHVNDVDLYQSGRLEVYGTLSIQAEFNMRGTMYNSGLSIIQNFRNRGYCCNSGTIKSSELIYIQGGHIECGGTLLTCELDMNSYNGATGVTGSPTAELNNQNICCENSGDPNPLDNLNGSWQIDSSSVQICTVPLMPNAGQDSSLSVCNTSSSVVDLNSMLSPDASALGGFGETTSSGAFNSVTGIFTTDGLTPGTYSFTYTVNGYTGVTDVADFTVIVNAAVASSESLTVCDNQFPFDWNGLSITDGGSFSVTLTSVITGCDSTITLNVQVNPTLNVTENIELCSNAFPFEWNGVTITEAGTSSVNLVSAVTGCDSIVTLNTSEIPIISTSESITICENDLPFEWNGLTIGQSGTESVVLSSAVTGCDSIITLNLSVNAIPTSSLDTLVCASQFPFSWNGLAINEFGSWEFVSTGANGCDSIANLNVLDGQLPAPMVYSNGPVTCPKDLVLFEISDEIPNATYEWFGPNNYTSSEVSNEIELTADMAGIYGVSYTLDGCSSAATYFNLAIDNVFDYETFKFPNVITANGDGTNDEIKLDEYIGACANFNLTIRDRWGSEVFSQERGEESFKGLSVDGRELPDGVYFYKLIFDQGSDVSGFLHIVRGNN